MEETAFLADLLVDSDKPLVFTGSQRAADEPDSDGPRNLVSAVRVAASEQARGLGALVVFDNEIHLARDVTKSHTSRLAAFESPEFGKAGIVDGPQVIVHRRRNARSLFKTERVEQRIDLIKLAMGANNRLIDCAVESGARGIVIEAFGRGNVTPKVLEAVRRAIERNVVVVVVSRCGRGRVEPVYGGSGGATLARAGALFAGDLSGVKARILLGVLLAHDPSPDAVERGLKCLAP
jgi:L-asparaginase